MLLTYEGRVGGEEGHDLLSGVVFAKWTWEQISKFEFVYICFSFISRARR